MPRRRDKWRPFRRCSNRACARPAKSRRRRRCRPFFFCCLFVEGGGVITATTGFASTPVGDELADAVAGDEQRVAVAAHGQAIRNAGHRQMPADRLQVAAVRENCSTRRVVLRIRIDGGRMQIRMMGCRTRPIPGPPESEWRTSNERTYAAPAALIGPRPSEIHWLFDLTCPHQRLPCFRRLES